VVQGNGDPLGRPNRVEGLRPDSTSAEPGVVGVVLVGAPHVGLVVESSERNHGCDEKALEVLAVESEPEGFESLCAEPRDPGGSFGDQEIVFSAGATGALALEVAEGKLAERHRYFTALRALMAVRPSRHMSR